MFCMGNNEQDNFVEDSTAKKIENYIFKYEDLLGKGNFGSAYRGYDVNTGKQVAIKVIKMASIKSKITEKLLENEIQILKTLNSHQNLLKCYDVFTSVNNCYIVTELCEYDLQEELKKKGKLRESQIKELVYGIFKGLEQLGRNSIVHRDIKISNIFLTKNKTPKIADFGFATKSNLKFKDVNIGTPLYMSPEGLLNHVYGPKTDVWSFGVLLYELLNGQTPLERCQTDEQIKSQILQPLRYFVPISLELRQLIQACLTVDETRRPNIFQLACFPYLRKLINEFQQRPFSLKESSHQSTECSEENFGDSINTFFFKQEIAYEHSLSLLHYCRLLHKVNKKVIKSQKLSQFLINLSLSLIKANISTNSTFNEQANKMKQVLHEYHSNFLMECEDAKVPIDLREVIGQIDLAMRNLMLRPFINLIRALESETKLLVCSFEHQNPEIFSKSSAAKIIIENNRANL